MDTRAQAAAVYDGASRTLARVSPHLFLFASVILLVAAIYRGSVLFVDGVSENAWLLVVKLFGRLAALLAITGLAVRLSRQAPRLGQACRTVATAAVVCTLVLVTLVTADNLGFTFGFVPLVGLGTFLLSVGAYLLSGIGIVRTETYPTLTGQLLVAAALALLAVFVGVLVLPVHWIGVTIEGLLFLFYLGVAYSLRTGVELPVKTQTASDTIPK